MANFSEHGNKLSGSTKAGNILTSWANINFLRRILHNGFAKDLHEETC